MPCNQIQFIIVLRVVRLDLQYKGTAEPETSSTPDLTTNRSDSGSGSDGTAAHNVATWSIREKSLCCRQKIVVVNVHGSLAARSGPARARYPVSVQTAVCD